MGFVTIDTVNGLALENLRLPAHRILEGELGHFLWGHSNEQGRGKRYLLIIMIVQESTIFIPFYSIYSIGDFITYVNAATDDHY